MEIRTYPGKVFTVESDKCVIRDENLNPLRYQAGDDIPQGKQVGRHENHSPGYADQWY